MATLTRLSNAFPLGSRLNELGRLEVGGCDTIDLAKEFGTPAYVVAEEDLRTRARAFVQAGRESDHGDLQVVFASKAFPCTAVLELFAQEGLWCDVASAGELHLALHAGVRPDRIVMHGNAKSREELRMAIDRGVGAVVLDNFDEIDRLELIASECGDGAGEPVSQPVLVRVTPDVRGDTHEKISTGQADSKFGFSMADAGEALARTRSSPHLELLGVHAHIGSQLLDLEPFRREIQQMAALGSFPVWDLGGGLGVAVHRRSARAAGDRGVRRDDRADGARGRHLAGGTAADRAGPVADCELVRDALHGRERQAERLALGGGRRGHV